MRQVTIGFKVDRLLMQDVLTAVQVFDELGSAARIVELMRLEGIFSLVDERDLQTFVENAS